MDFIVPTTCVVCNLQVRQRDALLCHLCGRFFHRSHVGGGVPAAPECGTCNKLPMQKEGSLREP